jgi:hypothetical protein
MAVSFLPFVENHEPGSITTIYLLLRRISFIILIAYHQSHKQPYCFLLLGTTIYFTCPE